MYYRLASGRQTQSKESVAGGRKGRIEVARPPGVSEGKETDEHDVQMARELRLEAAGKGGEKVSERLKSRSGV